jgi:drug/metabolite transporter (DMT)-like permease
VLLGQATTPFTMLFSYLIIGARYRINQYLGAGVVVVGMLVAISPQFIHSNGDALDEVCRHLYSSPSLVPYLKFD